MRGVKLGACIWTRRHTWQWNDRWIDSDERFYLLRVPAFAAVATDPDEWEMQYARGHHWWSLAEIVASKDTETFVPNRLPKLLPPILDELPAKPIDVGV